ncbi:unnamed protein product [marine sediment metagenome]|uniref:Pyruvate phosphate dikinase AMP/ATP-binding domain-containing protein n=1 Tax=marine sediment metagenome TaxID=412755 RepID=X1S7S7_9ZZZZ
MPPNFGLGESLVSGQINPDQYIIQKILKKGKKVFRIIDKRIGKKEFAFFSKETNGDSGIEQKILSEQKGGNLKCPRCETRGSINRISTGIWHCKKCNAKFTGGAYNTQTPRGAESFRIAKRKQRESEVIEE